MLYHVIYISVLVIAGSWASAPVWSASIPIENASFEAPVVDPNGFGALPQVDRWTEIDVDTLSSTNTGVFANTQAGSPDHIVNSHGSQLAFLGSQSGNALVQDLTATYKVGCDYQLTVAIGVSWRFPPSAEAPADTLELAFYYRDGNEPVDIVSRTVTALPWTPLLQDFSVSLPSVQPGDAWVGKAIGVALRSTGMPGGFWDLDHVRLIETPPALVPIENASFEAPVVDPNGFGALPQVDGWTEADLDTENSTNTGVFANTQAGSPDHIVNAHGSQLAFLGSQTGNALEQDLNATYKIGCDYQLTVAIGVSWRFPPSAEAPADTLELVLYYRDGNEPVDIVSQTVTALPWTPLLQDFSVSPPRVQPDDAWAGKAIDVAIRATGMPGGFWDLDNVRLIETPPVLVPIENASFEAPVVDPSGFGALPQVDGWTEADLDTENSTNTGVFANTPAGSPDHIVNADGSQLAFLGSQTGNALEQDLDITYKIGCDYQLTVAVGVSGRFPPSSAEPVDTFELVLYYRDANEPVDIVHLTVEATGLSVTQLTDVSLYLPTVQAGDAWAGMAIGVALRAAGMPGGFWDLDHVRLTESLPGPGLALTVKE